MPSILYHLDYAEETRQPLMDFLKYITTNGVVNTSKQKRKSNEDIENFIIVPIGFKYKQNMPEKQT